MPSVNSKERAVYVAVSVAACAGCLLGIGSLLMYQRLRQDARGVSCMARALDYHFLSPPPGASPFTLWQWQLASHTPVIPRRELFALRQELEDLRRLVGTLRDFKPPSPKQPPAALVVAEDITSGLYEHHVAKRPSTTSSSQDDEIEFYDAKSEQTSFDHESSLLQHSASNNFLHSSGDNLAIIYQKADILLATQDEGAPEARQRAYELLKTSYAQNRSNHEYLWRISRATYLYGRTFMDIDETRRKDLCFEAKDYAFEALALNGDSADVHKWCALTLGTSVDFVGITQKMKDGWTFKQHIDLAIKLRSTDATLRHLSGRWLFNIANLTWWERKLATSIFSAQFPDTSFDEALEEFLEADRLKPNWKENMLYIALCYHNIGDKEQTRLILEQARDMVPENIDDISVEKDIEKLWREYK